MLLKDILMKFDPETYTMTIRKELVDDELLYVGRVVEFPNISTYQETYEEAREMLVDSITTLKEIADDTKSDFPLPSPVISDEFNGRVTLRLPRTLHAKVSHLAAQENISVNQFLVYAISTHMGEISGSSKVISTATNALMNVISTFKIVLSEKTSAEKYVSSIQSTCSESTLGSYVMPSSFENTLFITDTNV